jgi:hypothetical protein
MPVRARALTLLGLLLLAACNGSSSEPAGSPSPSDTFKRGGLSLSDALPSPTPDQALPSMPPAMMGSFVFYEDFERGMRRWRIDGGSKGVGWHLLQASTCGGRFTMVLGRDKNPSARFAPSEARLTLQEPIQLPPKPPLQLKYDLKGVVSPPDAATVHTELRVGKGPWRSAGPSATARFPLMVSYRVDLTPFAGQTIGLRFRAVTRATADKHKGFYLDDIHVLQGTSPP